MRTVGLVAALLGLDAACAAASGARVLGQGRMVTRVPARPHAARAAASMLDMHAITGAVDALPHDLFAATHFLLADASAAAAPTDAAVVPADPGLFDQYVKFIQTCIVGLHGQIAGAGVPYAYGISIFLFTLCVKVLVLPLNWTQMQGTVAMQDLQPRTRQLQKWFGENQQALALETQNLYTSAKVNPLAGCLPSIAQIPVFIGLYRAIIGLSKDDILSESFLWIPTLEGPVKDYGAGLGWLTDNWVDGHPSLGWHDTACYLSLPLILVLSQSVSMRLMTPPADPDNPQAQSTQQIMRFLPLMIGWFSLSAPAGLGLYWFFNNVLTTAQSVLIKSLIKAGVGAKSEEEPQL